MPTPTDAGPAPGHPGAKHELHLLVSSPIDVHHRKFTFSETELVGDAATEAARAFGHEGEGFTFQDKDGVVLDRTQTLTAVGLHNGSHVELVNAGGGV